MGLLIALWLFKRVESSLDSKTMGHFGVGVLAGLSALGHVYGSFWMPVFALRVPNLAPAEVWVEPGYYDELLRLKGDP